MKTYSFFVMTAAVATAEDNNIPSSLAGLVDYLIVGAGGSGIQTALLLQKYGFSTQILEREDTAASFWKTFPIFGELISVNKKVRNETQRYRYDWHSFLETSVSMWDVSNDYFPTGLAWNVYMNNVVDTANIDIKYGVDVARLDEHGKPCVYLADGKAHCAKYRVFVGTGMREKDEPYLQAIGGVRYSNMKKDVAVGKRVCIFGNGNAGWEIAQNTYDVAESIYVIGKRPSRLSSVTKYTGDVRVKFLQPLENMHGKLLDSMVDSVFIDFNPSFFVDMNQTQSEEVKNIVSTALAVHRYQCEVLVLATGFRSSVPGMDLKDQRFPSMTDWYRTKTNRNIHYVGWLMHQNDFRKGAGGFLAGYRYLIRNLIHHVREEDHGIPYPHHKFTRVQALDHAAHRFQIASDLVILQDGIAIRDIILPVLNEDGEKVYHYYEGVTHKYFDFEQVEHPIYLYFAWGDGRSAGSVFDHVYLFNNSQTLRNIMLHPVVEVNGLVQEVQEDLDMAWKTDAFIPPIKRIVHEAIMQKYSNFYPKSNYSYDRTAYDRPEDYHPPALGQRKNNKFRFRDFMAIAKKAVQVGATEEALQYLRSQARSFLPKLSFHPDSPPSGKCEGSRGLDKNNYCVPGGDICSSESPDCCDGKVCVYVPTASLSFCVSVEM